MKLSHVKLNLVLLAGKEAKAHAELSLGEYKEITFALITFLW